MADQPKSLFQRLMERRAAIEAGDPTGASDAANAAETRNALGASQPKAPAQPAGGMKSKAAAALTRRPGESAAAFRRRQIEAAIAAGEL